MSVDFIFKFIFYSSRGNNDGLPHHKSEESGQKRTANNDSNIDQNLIVKAKVSVFCKLIYRFSYKLYLIYIEEITGNNK